MRQHLPARTLVLGWNGYVVTLISGRPSKPYPAIADVAAWRAAVPAGSEAVLLLDTWTAQGRALLDGFVLTHPDLFAPIHTLGTLTLYRIVAHPPTPEQP